MENCGSSLNRTQCYDEDGLYGCISEIPVDADVAGIGMSEPHSYGSSLRLKGTPQVLVAFLFAAVVTCASIFYGYATDSLPESLLSETDTAAMRLYEKTWIARRLVPWIGRLWHALKFFVYWCARRPTPQVRPQLPREQREEAITRFVLGFSDQQLARGLAILIAALANRCHLTVYEYRISFVLAWFSATIHVATLKILSEYFYAHPIVRNWRVIGIVTFLSLITVFQAFLIRAGDADWGRLIQCIIDGQVPYLTIDSYQATLDVYVLIWLLYIYISHTIALFRDPHETSSSGWRILKTTNQWKEGPSYKMPPETWKILVQNAWLQQDIMLSFRVSLETQRYQHSYRKYRHSLLSYLPTIVFSLVFGISQMIVITWLENPKTTDDVRRMGFGQVVALALLAIPALTAAEIYNGKLSKSTHSVQKLKEYRGERSIHPRGCQRDAGG